ncbi:imidazole glycerol phosphate synthase subunit HisH [Candidatus Poribacteria bacterium]|nr:imidazole glycerol phosphate synthase subunit HisH [Candidatus Poribacteria bacterium]
MIDVAIIDYNTSNLHSVQAACRRAKLSSEITSDYSQILDARVAILPGVGSFGEAMTQLAKSKLDECIYSYVDSGKPLIGICLGLQLLFETSEEFGNNKGLGLIKGNVQKFNFSKTGQLRYPVPHIGWNKLKQTASWKNTFLSNNTQNDLVYFVHSYYVEPDDAEVVLATTAYGEQEYCSVLQYKNIFATQFHPEKSGQVGIRIYQNLKTRISSRSIYENLI